MGVDGCLDLNLYAFVKLVGPILFLLVVIIVVYFISLSLTNKGSEVMVLMVLAFLIWQARAIILLLVVIEDMCFA